MNKYGRMANCVEVVMNTKRSYSRQWLAQPTLPSQGLIRIGLNTVHSGSVVSKLESAVRSNAKVLVMSSDRVIHIGTTMKDVKEQMVAVSSDCTAAITNNCAGPIRTS